MPICSDFSNVTRPEPQRAEDELGLGEGNTHSNTPSQTDFLQHLAEQERSSKEIEPVDRPLSPLNARFSTIDGKSLEINRREKPPGSDKVDFEIISKKPDDQSAKYYHSNFISNKNPDYDNKSTASYPGIYYPEAMKGQRVAYVHHKLIADAAKQLGVEKVVVENVGSDAIAMQKCCDGMGMDHIPFDNSRESDPNSMSAKAQEKYMAFGWSEE